MTTSPQKSSLLNLLHSMARPAQMDDMMVASAAASIILLLLPMLAANIILTTR